MDVFISWSGEASHIVGLALKDWLPSVIQSIEPFISSEDIAKGSRWFSEIGDKLERSNFGIICLTPDNYKEPWILFETGAISKSIGESCVAPILLGMSISELEGPIAQFNATPATREEILKLVKSINDKIDVTKERKLESHKLEKIFDALWPELDAKINECLAMLKTRTSSHTSKPKRKIDDILEELIELNRSNARLLSDLPNVLVKELMYINQPSGPIKSKTLREFALSKHDIKLKITELARSADAAEMRIVSLQNKLDGIEADLEPGLEKDAQKNMVRRELDRAHKQLHDARVEIKYLTSILEPS